MHMTNSSTSALHSTEEALLLSRRHELSLQLLLWFSMWFWMTTWFIFILGLDKQYVYCHDCVFILLNIFLTKSSNNFCFSNSFVKILEFDHRVIILNHLECWKPLEKVEIFLVKEDGILKVACYWLLWERGPAENLKGITPKFWKI